MILMGRNIAALSGAALAVLVAAPASADMRGPNGGQLILAQDNQELSEEERRRILREQRRKRQEGGQEDNAGNAEQSDEGENRRRVRRNEGQQSEEPQQEDSAGSDEQNERENRRRVRRDEGQQSEEQPVLSEREQRLRERRARQQAEQEEREKRARDRKQAQSDERQERLKRLEEERQRELKEAEERRESREERRKRELADQERDRRERAKRITEEQKDEGRDRRARRLEAIEGGELSQEERNERRRIRREFTSKNLGDIKRERRKYSESDGQTVIEEDNRRILRRGRSVIIEEDDSQRLRGAGRDVKKERGPRGRERTVITRRNGVQIITVRNQEGDVVRRIKKLKNGREIVLFNNEPRRKRRARRDDRDGFSFYINLPDLRVQRSRRDYYLYADRADEDEIEDILSAEPLEDFDEEYTLEEIRYSPDIRARFRKLNVNTVNFEFGSWEIRENQFDKLEVVARVINRIIERDESEMFLLAGHTDLVGSEEDNLSLSSRRTETVARILTDEFGVPPENLVTQGYGESDPLIDTEKPEAANRRVEFMRITPALAQYDE